MKTTILYLHESNACWMLWNGKKLLEVFSEPVPREIAEDQGSGQLQDVVVSKCPWLGTGSQRIRLVIDPVVDGTRAIPAFDPGLRQPDGVLDKWRASFNRLFLLLRSLTCNVWVDDLTHYRRDQLTRFPKALLLWRPVELNQVTRAARSSRPPSWQLTESGLPDFVFDWLSAMDVHGVNICDVRLVSSLLATEDFRIPGPVMTIWVEQHRCRLIRVSEGRVNKVQQIDSEIDARIALDDALATSRLEGETVTLRYIGDSNKIPLWQDSIDGVELLPRDDVLSFCLPSTNRQFASMPAGCRDLPLRALLSTPAWGYKSGRAIERTSLGSSLQVLLSSGLWRRRYRQSLIATAVVATFSGYFVLLALMHAFNFIDLHKRAKAESELVMEKQMLLKDAALKFHDKPFEVVSEIRRLPVNDLMQSSIDQAFLENIASMLIDNPLIHINSVSWRTVPLAESNGSSEASLSDVVELMRLPGGNEIEGATERLIFIAGNVDFDESQQHSSGLLMNFLDSISAIDNVVDVIPVSSALSSMPLMNFPSDVAAMNQPSAFVLAVRLTV